MPAKHINLSPTLHIETASALLPKRPQPAGGLPILCIRPTGSLAGDGKHGTAGSPQQPQPRPLPLLPSSFTASWGSHQ
ncbi:hypothetical protein AAFF_G00426380 [Aldrovandia affinis]|uniref:Uncharacterized protein n=1 Tax=Aldrovandia affinis TaxID=143900 RepID=A0AAD7WIS9_9TELE|nr:hypothetical protein AAFF_G00426380 [Aldrovandia affinis]